MLLDVAALIFILNIDLRISTCTEELHDVLTFLKLKGIHERWMQEQQKKSLCEMSGKSRDLFRIDFLMRDQWINCAFYLRSIFFLDEIFVTPLVQKY